jgi:hypothetical protein
MTRLPRTAASHALHMGLESMGGSRLLAETAAAGGGAGGGGGGAGSAAGGAVGGGGAGGGEGGDDEGTGSGTGVPLGDGDAESPRRLAELSAQGLPPTDRGPKPVLPRSGSGTGTGSGSGTGTGATGFEADPADRVGAMLGDGTGRKMGPATAEDAWMWEGVPPGGRLWTSYKPGERRYYTPHEGGPSLNMLPPAWPPGQGPDS